MPDKFRPRMNKTVLARLMLVCGGVVCGLLLTEAALRVLRISYPLPYLPDIHVGSRLRPGFQAWFNKEGHAFVEVNEAGFRDRTHVFEKPPKTLRIAVLGDSFAEAVQVDQSATFWSVLEQRLNATSQFSERPVEVLNFGISGHGTAQQLQMLRHYVLDYEPDFVLLAFFAGNDVRNNSRELEPDDVRPFFTLDKRERLQLDDSFLRHPDFLKATSAATRFKVDAINCSRVLQVVNEWKNRPPLRGGGATYFEPGVDDRVFAEPAEPEWQAAWRVTEALITAIHREAREHQAQLVVATVTQAVQLHPDRAIRQQFADQLGVEDLQYPEQRIKALGAEYGFPVVPLFQPMLQVATGERQFLHGFENTGWGKGHWNQAGHRLAGELIAEALLSEINRE